MSGMSCEAGEGGLASAADRVCQGDAKQAASWQIKETPSFVIYWFGSPTEAERLGGRCESLRRTLEAKWLGSHTASPWSPRCDVVVHATRESYVQVVGPSGAQTNGASSIAIRNGQVVARRLDLMAGDEGSEVPALPHELTHVVLAARFCRGRLPAWADEGMAVLEDPPEKRRLHERDRRAASEEGASIPLGDLLAMRDCPCGSQCGAFYGQSAALAAFLTSRDKPQRFVDFVEQAMHVGPDAALRQIYGIHGVRDLERLWAADLAARQIRDTLAEATFKRPTQSQSLVPPEPPGPMRE
jgi:hypothetical protein